MTRYENTRGVCCEVEDVKHTCECEQCEGCCDAIHIDMVEAAEFVRNKLKEAGLDVTNLTDEIVWGVIEGYDEFLVEKGVITYDDDKHGDEDDELVVIPKAEYEGLLEASNKLDALEGHGVDNWCGYDDAMSSLRESDEA